MYTNINDIFLICLELYGIPINKTVKASKSNITKFEYNFGDKKYIIVQDPNDITITNWAKVKELCIKHEIPFKNQTFQQFIKECRTKVLNKKSERHQFTEDDKNALYQSSTKRCATCKEQLKKKFETDHIRSLANGGTNKLKKITIIM